VSGSAGNAPSPARKEARADKTRGALLGSLIRLVHGRRYDQFDVNDIARGAQVGRSTFYDHYRGKDDMIFETMSGMLGVMSEVASGDADFGRLETVLAHFRENRKSALNLFLSDSGRAVVQRLSRELARRIEAHLIRRFDAAQQTPAIPLTLLAEQLAAAQFAWVSAWLADERCTSPAQLARGMHLSASGSIAAVIRQG
jgi:AcrR family transcriptional regulator